MTPRPRIPEKLRRVLVLAAVLFAVYAGVLIVARISYRRFLYPAPSADRLPSLPRSASLKEFRAKDGVPVHAIHIPAPPDAPTVVHFHGNGETIGNTVGLGTELARRGLGVMLVEYRGYGISSGPSPSEEGLYLDAEAALGALESEGISPSQIVLWGTSLGSGVAAEMAARGRGRALLLVTPFTSIRALATRLAPILPASLYMGDHYDTLGKASAIRVPTLIIHGDRDELVPYSMGQALAVAIPGARLVTIDGGGHNDLFVRAPEIIIDQIVSHSLRR